MAKGKNKRTDPVDLAAEAIGRALGSIAGTFESMQTEHPHPLDEAREAIAARQKTMSTAASRAGTRAGAVVKKAKAAARRTKQAATRAGQKRKAAVSRVKRTARKVVKRAKKAVARGRKTAKRAAKRLKR